MEYCSKNLLQHRYPFLFIKKLYAFDNHTAEAKIDFFRILPDWMISLDCSSLPIEFAAQLMGARYRLNQTKALKSGFLSKIEFFSWVKNPEPIASLNVALILSQGDFYSFSAQFFCSSGEICANALATLYISYKETYQVRTTSVVTLNLKNNNIPNNSLFLPDKREAKRGKTVVTVNEQCPIFLGHFPNNPITPGVLLIDIMISTALELKDCDDMHKWQLASIWDAVFQSPIFPGDRLVIKVKEEQKNNFFASIFNNNEKRCARAKFSMKNTPK